MFEIGEITPELHTTQALTSRRNTERTTPSDTSNQNQRQNPQTQPRCSRRTILNILIIYQGRVLTLNQFFKIRIYGIDSIKRGPGY